jgi:hypothetical protein
MAALLQGLAPFVFLTIVAKMSYNNRLCIGIMVVSKKQDQPGTRDGCVVRSVVELPSPTMHFSFN